LIWSQIKFSYRPSNFRIIDNGHTVQVEVGENSINLTGKTYELVQFHFHRPSEEKVNGQRFRHGRPSGAQI
jgi:carbonic anhydrase